MRGSLNFLNEVSVVDKVKKKEKGTEEVTYRNYEIDIKNNVLNQPL